MNPIVKKLSERHTELGKIIANHPTIVAEFNEVEQTLALLRKQFPHEFEDETETISKSDPNPAPQPLVVTTEASIAKPTITNLATLILASSLPLHAKILMAELRKRGWKGSGDDFKDARNIAITLGGRPDTFANVGMNTWTLRSKVAFDQKASS